MVREFGQGTDNKRQDNIQSMAAILSLQRKEDRLVTKFHSFWNAVPTRILSHKSESLSAANVECLL